MKWLLWKEYRLHRLILCVSAGLIVLPYAVPAVRPPHDYLAEVWSYAAWSYAAFIGIILSVLPMALLGGNAFATERADGSAEFLAYQPIDRRSIVISKLVFPLVTALVSWSVPMGVLTIARARHADLETLSTNQFLSIHQFYMFIAIGFCAFSAAWLVSSLQNSPTFAIGAGMAAPIVIMFLIAGSCWLLWLITRSNSLFGLFDSHVELIWAAINLIAGTLFLAAGTRHYLRRVEP